MIGGATHKRQAPRAAQCRRGMLVCLVSYEGNSRCRKMVRRCSRTWNLSPKEVLYVDNRFYGVVTDYHFAVVTQEFLYGQWPLEPLKSRPGEAALTSRYFLHVLSLASLNVLTETHLSAATRSSIGSTSSLWRITIAKGAF